MTCVGITAPEVLRLVTRAHILAWRKGLERRELAATCVRRKLAALSSLFEYLSEANAVTHNPVKGAGGRRSRAMRERRRRSGIRRHGTSWGCLLATPSKRGVIARSSPCCSITFCGARGSPSSPYTMCTCAEYICRTLRLYLACGV